LINFLLVAAGGAIGASLRFSSGHFFKSYIFPNHYFLSTLLINILGSFFIGWIISFTQGKNFSDDLIKYFIIIGILGSFTTFSTFSIETVELIVANKVFLASIYILLSFILCIAFTFLGLNINKFIS